MNVESVAVKVSDGTSVNVTVNKKSSIVLENAVVHSVKITAVFAVVKVSQKDHAIAGVILKIVTTFAVVQLLWMTVKFAVVLVLTGSMVNVIVKVMYLMSAVNAVVQVFQLDGRIVLPQLKV
jgi:hypothetical protein